MKIFEKLNDYIDLEEAANEFGSNAEIVNPYYYRAEGLLGAIEDEFYWFYGNECCNLRDIIYVRKCDLPEWWDEIEQKDYSLSVTVGDDVYSSRFKGDSWTQMFRKNDGEEYEISDGTDSKRIKFAFCSMILENNIPTYTIDDLVDVEAGYRSYCLWDEERNDWIIYEKTRW